MQSLASSAAYSRQQILVIGVNNFLMMKNIHYIRIATILIVSSFVLTSCATIFSGAKAQVTVASPDARRVNLIVDKTQYGEVDLPKEITIRRGFSPTIIKASADGKEGELVVRKTFNEIGLVNILLGGIPGLIVDCATGAITKPEMGLYNIYLNNETQPPEVQIPYRPAEDDY